MRVAAVRQRNDSIECGCLLSTTRVVLYWQYRGALYMRVYWSSCVREYADMR